MPTTRHPRQLYANFPSSLFLDYFEFGGKAWRRMGFWYVGSGRHWWVLYTWFLSCQLNPKIMSLVLTFHTDWKSAISFPFSCDIRSIIFWICPYDNEHLEWLRYHFTCCWILCFKKEKSALSNILRTWVHLSMLAFRRVGAAEMCVNIR